MTRILFFSMKSEVANKVDKYGSRQDKQIRKYARL